MLRNVSKYTKHFIKWAHNRECMLCSFSSKTHLHHVIPVDAGGPDHVLNLVPLCPNCHAVVEKSKRHVFPEWTTRDSKWRRRAQKIKDFRAEMDSATQALFDQLANPHPCNNPDVMSKARAGDNTMVQALLGHSADLLHYVNQERPLLFFGCVDLWKTGGEDIRRICSSLDGRKMWAKLNSMAEEFASEIGRDKCEAVARHHLINAAIPLGVLTPGHTVDPTRGI